MIVLVGYSVAGLRIVVVVRSARWADVGCLGNRVLLHDGGGPSGYTWGGSQFVSGRSTERYYSYLVML